MIDEIVVKMQDGSEVPLTPELMDKAMMFIRAKMGDEFAAERMASEAKRAKLNELVQKLWHEDFYPKALEIDPELELHDAFLALSGTIPWSLVGDYDGEADPPVEDTGTPKDEVGPKWARRRAAMAKYIDDNDFLKEYFANYHYHLLAPMAESWPGMTEYQLCCFLLNEMPDHLDYLEERMEGITTGYVDDPHDWTEIDALENGAKL